MSGPPDIDMGSRCRSITLQPTVIVKTASKQIETALKEVIEAAENSDTGRLRKEALAALEELKKKGPEYKRNIAWWGTAGETAISAGCLAAAVTGQVAMGLLCVLGGALSSAALKHLAAPE